MKLLVLSSNYPSLTSPQVGTFVYKLIQEFSSLNHEVVVVSPQKRSYKTTSKASGYGEEKAKVFRPTHWSFSNFRFFSWNTYSLTSFFQSKAIKKIVVNNAIKPDVVYCHFIGSAFLYYKAFPKSTLPLFIAVGEYKNIEVLKSYYDISYYNSIIKRVTGFIAVSPQIKNRLIELGVPDSKIIIEPNGADLSIFKPLDKKALREKYNLPLDKKLILFIGRFIENKGPLRVLEAINQLSDDVVGIFVGKGPQVIEGNKVCYKGTVAHNQIPEMMSMADVFVMPSEHEGSSNVIVEAMSCGVPIVSSNIPEIRVQCDPSFSILVDPRKVNEIKEAIFTIISDKEKCDSMRQAALSYSKKFDIKDRAKRILNFIDYSLN
jgi:teichuronic acid biosynthesis glycosyltransferase TuaC